MNTTRIHAVLLILLLQSLAARGDIYGLWIPNSLDITTEGNSYSALPINFWNATNFTTYDGPTSFGFGIGFPATCPQTHPLSSSILFTTPFFYDPSKGNLLIDIRHSGFKSERAFAVADAQNTIGDGISRIAALSLTAATADIVDTEGLVTVFTLKPTPSLTITIQTNILDLVWPTDPDGRERIVRFTNSVSPEEGNCLPHSSVVINELLTHTDAPLEDAISDAGTGWIEDPDDELIELHDISVAGKTHTLQYRDRLLDGPWHTVTEIPSPNTSGSIQFPDLSANGAQARFYRVILHCN